MSKKLKVPTTAAGQFLFFAAIELVACFILVWNTRAISKGSYPGTGVSEFIFSFNAFTVFKLLLDDPNGRSWASGFGGATGAAVGALLSLYLTKMLGQ